MPERDPKAVPGAPPRRVALCVNVDHVATVRQARRAGYPQPAAAAALAEEAGAAGITVHLREDRRHIQRHDVEELRRTVRGKLNLEIAGTESMLRVALDVHPDQVTLVPERPDEITTEGGLDLTTQSLRIQRVASTLARDGIAVSVFIDPEEQQVQTLAGMDDIEGFEINTDAYSRAAGAELETEAETIAVIARAGAASGRRVFAGHGLTTDNVGRIAAVPEIEELNIGHFLVSRAVLVGMREAVREMLDAIAAAQT